MFRDYTKYEVYDDGRIYSYKTKRFLKPQTNKDGYQTVNLVDNEGKRKMYRLHRVVWEAVTGSPIPKNLEVNHISENKASNMISNLELVSHKQNCNYGSRNARISKANTNRNRSKSVGAFKDGELIMVFPSTMEAKRQGFSQGNVAACCRGERNTHKGYTWKYI